MDIMTPRFAVLMHVLYLVLVLVPAFARSDLAARCDTCREIVKKFKEGLVKTAKSNFGGGNTHWEEKNLGSYAFSETRLLEIMENVCHDSGKECHHMLEAHEEIIEQWWFKHYAKSVDTDLNQYLCVTRMRACCPSGTYGMECRDCLGGRTRPCKGNGRCKGDGTRSGPGTCECHPGYAGELCDECTDGYYEESKNSTHTVCTQCHVSCKLTCSEGGPTGCDDCRPGWQLADDEGCIDENECEDEIICNADEYCINTEGSYKCLACSSSCRRCTGPSAADCVHCASRHYRDDTGYCKPCHVSCAKSCTNNTPAGCDACTKGWTRLHDGSDCIDVDECASENATSLCDADEYCVNTVGSYKCSTCHPSCMGCTSAGNNKCIQCKVGYAQNDQQQCVDIDECGKPESCAGPQQRCVNTPGSFRCDCEKGFVMTDIGCQPESSESAKAGKSRDTGSSSASQKPSSSPNTQKRPQSSGNSKKSKTSTRDRARQKALRKKGWMYSGGLVGFVVIAVLLRSYVLLQSVLSVGFWIYLYWLCPQIDKAVHMGR